MKTKTNKGIELFNGHTIKPVVLDCCLGTTGEGPPSFFGGINKNKVINSDNATIVLKSITRNSKIGNFGYSIFDFKNGWAKGVFSIPLPKKFCYFSLLGITDNSFGLTNPGIDNFLDSDWKTIEKIGKPVIISVFIDFGDATEFEIKKAHEDAKYMMEKIDANCDKKLLIAVIFNASCPNVKAGVCNISTAIVDCAKLMKETAPTIPVGVKLSYVQNVELGVRLYNEGKVDFLQAINTIPWKEIFKYIPSPLQHIGGGGLSGFIIRKRALEYLTKLRFRVKDAKIIGGGGICNMKDAEKRSNFSDCIAIGVLVNKKPGLVNKIIKYINNKN